MKLVTVTELSEIIGISKAAISKALKQGKLRKIGEERNAKIDLHDLLTVKYLKAENDKRPNYTTQGVNDGVNQSNSNEMAESRQKNLAESREEAVKIKQSPSGSGLYSKEDMDIRRLETVVEKNKIEIAFRKNELIKRTLVENLFGKVNSSIINSLHPFSDRIMPLISSTMECQDNNIITESKKIIDKEIMRTVADFKNQIIKGLEELLINNEKTYDIEK